MTQKIFALLTGLLMINACAQAQQQRVVRVSGPKAVQPAEVSVAINPHRPDNIVVVSFQQAFPGGKSGTTNYAYSTMDDGRSWQQVANSNAERRTQGDDAITFGADGTAYHSYISFKGLRQKRPQNARNGIFVTRSKNGGTSWSEPVPVIDHLNTVAPFEDKPWPVVDRSSGSPYSGNVYLSWTRFDVYGSHSPQDSTQIYFTRSEDGGRSFAMPFPISDHGGDAVDSSNTVEGAVPAVGPDGAIYVAWAGPLGIMMDRSTDGGWTFGHDVHVADNPGGWDFEIQGLGRANGMPVTAVDRSDGPYRGTVYVNWIDLRHGDPDVFLASSTDGGQTWSEPVRVNDDPVGNGKEQFFTWMAVDPTDGTINIAFYDRRGLDGAMTGLTLARSTDGGHTFKNYRIKQQPFEATEKVFFGDYIGVDAYDGRTAVAYMHYTSADSLGISAALFDFKQ